MIGTGLWTVSPLTESNRRPSPYHLGAWRTMKVIDAGQRPAAVDLAQYRSAQLLHFAAAQVTFVVLAAGVTMPMLFDVLAWAALVVGVLSAARYLIMLTARSCPSWLRRGARIKLLLTEKARREAWRWFRFSLFCAFDGLFILDRGWASATTRWLVAIAATVVLLWDRGLWLRSHMRRHPAN
jgi:hypothetical protein